MKAQIFNWHGWVEETRPDYLVSEYKGLLKKCGFTMCEMMTHFFSPYGFTALILLSESHFAIHTFPEENRTYIELSSCVEAPFDRFVAAMEGGKNEKEQYPFCP